MLAEVLAIVQGGDGRFALDVGAGKSVEQLFYWSLLIDDRGVTSPAASNADTGLAETPPIHVAD